MPVACDCRKLYAAVVFRLAGDLELQYSSVLMIATAVVTRGFRAAGAEGYA